MSRLSPPCPCGNLWHFREEVWSFISSSMLGNSPGTSNCKGLMTNPKLEWKYSPTPVLISPVPGGWCSYALGVSFTMTILSWCFEPPFPSPLHPYRSWTLYAVGGKHNSSLSLGELEVSCSCFVGKLPTCSSGENQNR